MLLCVFLPACSAGESEGSQLDRFAGCCEVGCPHHGAASLQVKRAVLRLNRCTIKLLQDTGVVTHDMEELACRHSALRTLQAFGRTAAGAGAPGLAAAILRDQRSDHARRADCGCARCCIARLWSSAACDKAVTLCSLTCMMQPRMPVCILDLTPASQPCMNEGEAVANGRQSLTCAQVLLQANHVCAQSVITFSLARASAACKPCSHHSCAVPGCHPAARIWLKLCRSK